MTIRLRPGTYFDEDELASRRGYGATLTDTSGIAWFVRVEASEVEALSALGLREAAAGGRPIVLGAVRDEDGDDCRVYVQAQVGHFVLLSRSADAGVCPSSAEDVREWLPEVEAAGGAAGDVGVAVEALRFGKRVGAFDGVEAYSNGFVDYDSRSHSDYGLKWQCVEYVNRFYGEALGHQNLIGKGHATSYFGTAAEKGLVAFSNPSPTRPAVGDMVASNGRDHGHIAIIREVGDDYINVIHQNWANDASDNSKRLRMTFANGEYSVDGFSASYDVVGWMRRPVSQCASVSSVTASSASFNQRTVFTIAGACLPSSVAPWIAECEDLHVESIHPTLATFSCTPRYTRGRKQGVVRTEPGGALLASFTIDVL